MGMIPPSDKPMSIRAPSIVRKVDASPDANEQAEKASVASTSSPLREPQASETMPIRNAAHAQVSESAPARIPTWVLFRSSSGCTNGIRKFSALRSKNTMPKLMLSRAGSSTW